jgi:phage-related protein
MSIQTFSWFPDADSKHSVKPNVLSATFGDGYQQNTPKGLNNMPMSWQLKFTRTRAEGLAIIAFLRGRKGSEPFIWANPFNETGTYICKNWDSNSNPPEVLNVSCTFEQVFGY